MSEFLTDAHKIEIEAVNNGFIITKHDIPYGDDEDVPDRFVIERTDGMYYEDANDKMFSELVKCIAYQFGYRAFSDGYAEIVFDKNAGGNDDDTDGDFEGDFGQAG
jgi:hypothetical protein